MILGIAGKACSGKNEAASFLEKRGYYSIDVDRLGHIALEEKKNEVVCHFGSHILDGKNSIDRKKLGSIVFKDRKKLKTLESITHPVIFSMVEDLIRTSDCDNVVINAAILGKSPLVSLCGKVLWIEAPLIDRVRRALARDGSGIIRIIKRIRSQRDLTVQHFSADVDIYMVRNKGSIIDLEKQIDVFLSDPEFYKRV